ncbi:hypothetical protein O6H91_19G029900 [Diphasiastrum complanatum]|uniref:Uncharacterized protein n=1 Tax=Diphasiastrum complanatum TaxID=34168 RepID=A0ACC2ATR9_DIPCM|nr:hypothetical protein O6H91_19G029900 [Diphasiastrum complanatum]
MDRITNNCLSHPHLNSSTQGLMMADSLGEDHDMKAPKKRAETWVQEETKALIHYRKEMDSLFNTTKSNKHLWEQISAKMKERGYDRSPTMCIDKWRNLLKEYKKAKHQNKAGSSKLSCYRDLEELLGERARQTPYKHATKLDGMQPSPSGTMRSSFNLEHRLDHDGHLMAIPSTDANGLIAWGWRDPCSNDANCGGSPIITLINFLNILLMNS